MRIGSPKDDLSLHPFHQVASILARRSKKKKLRVISLFTTLPRLPLTLRFISLHFRSDGISFESNENIRRNSDRYEVSELELPKKSPKWGSSVTWGHFSLTNYNKYTSTKRRFISAIRYHYLEVTRSYKRSTYSHQQSSRPPAFAINFPRYSILRKFSICRERSFWALLSKTVSVFQPIRRTDARNLTPSAITRQFVHSSTRKDSMRTWCEQKNTRKKNQHLLPSILVQWKRFTVDLRFFVSKWNARKKHT